MCSLLGKGQRGGLTIYFFRLLLRLLSSLTLRRVEVIIFLFFDYVCFLFFLSLSHPFDLGDYLVISTFHATKRNDESNYKDNTSCATANEQPESSCIFSLLILDHSPLVPIFITFSLCHRSEDLIRVFVYVLVSKDEVSNIRAITS